MPKRTDLKSILIIGAGPIVIGQACEFDYSGAQACKALRQEGYRVVLVNSNPATIMTDPEMADATYIEPITWQTVARIIEKERPDALLPTMGGQTALNCALDLAKHGVLEKFGVEMIGASREAIDKAEDRDTRGFISITTMRPSAGLIANCTFDPPVSTPISRRHAIEALRMIWYSLSVSVKAGATVIESPVWMPIGSTFSIEQMMMQLSFLSRTTSISNSFQPSTDSSTSTVCTGEAASPVPMMCSNSSVL